MNKQAYLLHKDIHPLRLDRKVNSKNGNGIGIWGNKRIVRGIRIDEKLYEAAKPILKAKFGSTCRAIESFLVAIIVCNKAEVNLSSTTRGVDEKIVIEKMVIERNLRTRRGLVEDTSNHCDFRGCKKTAIATGTWHKREYKICADHMKNVDENPREWEVKLIG